MPWRARKLAAALGGEAEVHPGQAQRGVGGEVRREGGERVAVPARRPAPPARRAGRPRRRPSAPACGPSPSCAASYPRGPRCGPVLTLWVSMIAAVGRRFRPRGEAAAGDQDGERPVEHRPQPPAREPAPHALVRRQARGRPAAAARRTRRAPGATAPRAWSRSTSPAGARSCRADRSCRSSPRAARASPAATPPGWPARTCAGPRPSTPSLASSAGSREIGSAHLGCP